MPEAPKPKFTPEDVDDVIKHYGKPLNPEIKERLISKLKPHSQKAEIEDSKPASNQLKDKDRSI